MSGISSSEILERVAGILQNFHGHDYAGKIDENTRFFADLGLASIDAVVLGEALESHFGRKLPFGELMGDLGSRVERDLPIGELASFLEIHLNARSV